MDCEDKHKWKIREQMNRIGEERLCEADLPAPAQGPPGAGPGRRTALWMGTEMGR